tara:strand:- start:439 stop:639 length:201 start_codon:yes stop_codon:yes gene_type:complete
MSVMKNEYIEHRISVEEVEEGLRWLSMWGKKSFKDHTGEWVEVRCSTQPNFFDDTVEAIPHVLEVA